MEENKREKIRLTIERQLEQFYLNDAHHAERYEVLWHAWHNNKRWLIQLLQTTLSSFPSYSKHDESHASTVLTNIEMILGEKRIRELSATDCFMILHTVYIHDIGMVITHTDRENIVKNEKFLEMVDKLNNENDFVFQKAIKALRQTKYEYPENDNEEETMKQLYADKLKVYYALLHLIANYRRTEHGNFSEERLTKWTLESDKLGAGFSMAGIPQRIFLHIAKCAGLHTQAGFDHIMKLLAEDDGYVGDYAHPRFVSVLLQLGDLLDMDNDRFHPLIRECIGALPEMSERHFEKHQSIRRLYIRPETISIEADCRSQEALRLVRKECDMLKEILQEAGYNWTLIRPENFSGSLPTIDSVKLSLNGVQIPEELVTAQFHISQKKAFAILEGGNVYQDKFVFLREFLQNAVDASKMQYWVDYLGTKRFAHESDNLKLMDPNEMNEKFPMENFPVSIRMEIVKRNEEHQEFPVTEEDKEKLIHGDKSWEYGVKVSIRDFGTGIDKESILNIAKVGNSRRREHYMIKDMPEWLKPTAEFGIGLQSAFILTDTFKCDTFLRSGEKYEITFSSVKSAYYEGYINVRPSQKDKSYYGTCFEVFIPEKKKLTHELYPLTWDGKDYFDEDYNTLSPIRHSAELIAQMAMYLDSQIGEQLFPVELEIIENSLIEVPINTTEKNRMQHLKCNLNKYGEKENEILNTFGDYLKNKEKEYGRERIENYVDELQFIFKKRKWTASELAWIFYPDISKSIDDRKVNAIQNKDMLIEKTEKTIAMLDSRDGSFYFWDKTLCTLCTVNMKNFLLMEQRERENTDKHCERISQGVVIYYKGILLDEMELPDLGNEMIEYIDIKGKLSREYINLSRRGFTEKGRAYFYEQIYKPLLTSVYQILQNIDKNKSRQLLSAVKKSLDTKLYLLKDVDTEIRELTDIQIDIKFDSYHSVQLFKDVRNRLLIIFKESIVTLTMLAFFAQKESFTPQVSLLFEKEKRNVWSELLEYVCSYADEIADEFSNNSVLFHIEVMPKVSLTTESSFQTSGNNSKTINFADIFSDKNQYMIVSRRENIYAPWKQFMIPVWEHGDAESESFIEIYKEYIASGESGRKNVLYDILQNMGHNALEIGIKTGKNLSGKDRWILTDNYSQQFFLKWMTRHVPTAAMFVSDDGNTRVNFIHGQVFPCIFVNMAYKKLVVQRVMEYANKYNMQRFSIPAWQNTELLSCDEFPYVLYFVKRGYASREALKKVIFPLNKDNLSDIQKLINSEEACEKSENLNELFGLLNIRFYLRQILLNDVTYIADILNDRRKWKRISEEKMEKYLKAYEEFVNRWENGDTGTERILQDIVKIYRDFVVKMLNAYYERKDNDRQDKEPVVKLEMLKDDEAKWQECITYIIIEVIVNNYLGETTGILKMFTEKYGDMVAKWWNYVIEKRYIQDVSLVAQFQRNYMKDMENEGSSVYQSNARIVAYIESRLHLSISNKYIWQYWRQYVSDIFETIVSIELEGFYNPELVLSDWNYLKEKIK